MADSGVEAFAIGGFEQALERLCGSMPIVNSRAPKTSAIPAVGTVEVRWPLAGMATTDNPRDEAAVVEQRLFGSDNEDDRFAAYQPFTREIGVDGVISSSFDEAINHAAIPRATMLEATKALATAIDLGRDVQREDRFYVRYEQQFAALGAAVGVARVLWAELHTQAKGMITIHRFRTRDQGEHFYLPNGQAATAPSMRLPLDVVTISSGFGLRADPFDYPAPLVAIGKTKLSSILHRPAGAYGRLQPQRTTPRIANGRRQRPGEAPGVVPVAGPPRLPARAGALFMHDCIDLAAPAGTPIYAAADGVVAGAEPNGRYGNWIRIEHGQNRATVYGHMMAFAPGIQPGGQVMRGELIGFVGTTGRSTGSHLHFELQVDGRPVDPITSPELKALQLRGADFERFRKQVAASLAEREREAEIGTIGRHFAAGARSKQ
jgi:murein DD-endopeptidase MepM/ murein hydrolase activator NlpD